MMNDIIVLVSKGISIHSTKRKGDTIMKIVKLKLTNPNHEVFINVETVFKITPFKIKESTMYEVFCTDPMFSSKDSPNGYYSYVISEKDGLELISKLS